MYIRNQEPAFDENGFDIYNGVLFGYDKSREDTTISIPDGVSSIEKGAFANCNNLESVALPKSIQRISDYAFIRCKNLKSITAPDNTAFSIGNSVFFDCESLESISAAIEGDSIGFNAFENCISLKDINISDSVQVICEAAFKNCKSLEKINIPDNEENISVIGRYAFAGCDALKTVAIPDSVQVIGNGSYDSTVFKDCPNLTVVCNKNSSAYNFAKENGIKVKTIKARDMGIEKD